MALPRLSAALALVFLANVAPQAAALRAHRYHAGADRRVHAGANARAHARREFDEMKETAHEVGDAIITAASLLETAMQQVAAPVVANATNATNASVQTNRTAAVSNTSRPSVPAPAVNKSVVAAAAHPSHGLSNTSADALKTQQEVLKKLFAHMKTSISRLNKDEEYSKKTVQNQTQRLEERLERDRKKSQDPSLSATDREMYLNRTRLEENEMKYWTRGRELQHGMFHANIKMTHGLMSRVKTVMDAYQDFLTKGHMDPDLAKALKSVSENLPGVKGGGVTA